MAERRAHADTYARRINRAVELLGERTPAAARRALEAEYGLSERQARRYVRAAELAPAGVPVPERTEVFTVRLPPSLIARLRAAAAARGESLSATVARAAAAGLGSGRGGEGREGGAAG